MTDEEKDFLLAEFDSAWSMVRDIDNRRGDFLKYYTGIVTAALAIPLGIIATAKAHDLHVYIGSSILLVFTIIAGISIMYVLNSERRANIRYRLKLNSIREIFIANSASPEIVRYRGDVPHRQRLGIPLLSDPTQPQGRGQTLRGIYWLIVTQQIVIVIALCALWASWWWGVRPMPEWT